MFNFKELIEKGFFSLTVDQKGQTIKGNLKTLKGGKVTIEYINNEGRNQMVSVPLKDVQISPARRFTGAANVVKISGENILYNKDAPIRESFRMQVSLDKMYLAEGIHSLLSKMTNGKCRCSFSLGTIDHTFAMIPFDNEEGDFIVEADGTVKDDFSFFHDLIEGLRNDYKFMLQVVKEKNPFKGIEFGSTFNYSMGNNLVPYLRLNFSNRFLDSMDSIIEKFYIEKGKNESPEQKLYKSKKELGYKLKTKSTNGSFGKLKNRKTSSSVKEEFISSLLEEVSTDPNSGF